MFLFDDLQLFASKLLFQFRSALLRGVVQAEKCCVSALARCTQVKKLLGNFILPVVLQRENPVIHIFEAQEREEKALLVA